jgi:predicted PurR-regulated permease PerM
LSLNSWVLSVEQGYRFYIILGIAVAVCFLVSVLEELVLFSQIMKGVAEMNPTMMLVSFSVWGYILGVLGLLIHADKVLMQATVVKS